ncbi:MAG: hypothetical protein HY597_02960 [Candidatus Omnitrophica bacterium]|nr:hypothetical protein [Candidatus Omnitrophota bacterium]
MAYRAVAPERVLVLRLVTEPRLTCPASGAEVAFQRPHTVVAERATHAVAAGGVGNASEPRGPAWQ